MTDYSVKAVKTFYGHDGNGWECKLYRDGKSIALVVEDGWGGGLQFHWKDENEARVECQKRNYDDSLITYKATPEQAKLETCVLAQAQQDSPFSDDDSRIFINADIFVSDMVGDVLVTKDVKKMLKKVAIFDGGKVYTYNVAPSHSTVRTEIAKKYPNAIILNDVSISEAVEIYKGAE
tara:strand:- start:798 stop:1331 length:534 start_codon:yes stop_codon:yes gene_type:complete